MPIRMLHKPPVFVIINRQGGELHRTRIAEIFTGFPASFPGWDVCYAYLYRDHKRHFGKVFRELARRAGCKILEGHLLPDHAHMLISIPPEYAVSQVVGFIKDKRAIHVARKYLDRRKNFTEQHFWARDYHVSTVGRDEEAIRKYIKEQEREDQMLDQLNIFR